MKSMFEECHFLGVMGFYFTNVIPLAFLSISFCHKILTNFRYKKAANGTFVCLWNRMKLTPCVIWYCCNILLSLSSSLRYCTLLYVGHKKVNSSYCQTQNRSLNWTTARPLVYVLWCIFIRPNDQYQQSIRSHST